MKAKKRSRRMRKSLRIKPGRNLKKTRRNRRSDISGLLGE
nr:MAG TPA: hypothetical protein [Caudoviricetes sp.]